MRRPLAARVENSRPVPRARVTWVGSRPPVWPLRRDEHRGQRCVGHEKEPGATNQGHRGIILASPPRASVTAGGSKTHAVPALNAPRADTKDGRQPNERLRGGRLTPSLHGRGHVRSPLSVPARNRAFWARLRWNRYGTERAQPVADVGPAEDRKRLELAPNRCYRLPPAAVMVRRGSTVRVRQRALRSSC